MGPLLSVPEKSPVLGENLLIAVTCAYTPPHPAVQVNHEFHEPRGLGLPELADAPLGNASTIRKPTPTTSHRRRRATAAPLSVRRARLMMFLMPPNDAARNGTTRQKRDESLRGTHSAPGLLD
jgi:hypothetical protein